MTKLNQALAQAEALLLEASFSPSLDTNLSIAFGDNYNLTIANNILSSWRNGNFSNLPTIKVLSSNLMNGAQGAYSTSNNTIYLSSTLIDSQSITAIRDVIIEEIGHFIDAQINIQDSQGDEGEIWKNLLLNNKMSTAQLNTLRNENDFGIITVDGEILNVEKSVITLDVTTTLDENDGSATIGSGLSLRDAIIIANNDTDNEYIINLAEGETYSLTLGSSGEDNSIEGDLDIMDGANVTIRTNENFPASINGTNIFGGDGIFHVLKNGTLTLEKLRLTGGKRDDFGGGVINYGTAMISNSIISGNSAFFGGGIYNDGNLTIVQTTISENSATSGGGISNGGDLTIVQTTISENSATFGGGISNGGDLTIVQTTISGNSAVGVFGEGGGFTITI